MARNYECVLILDVSRTDEEKKAINRKVKEIMDQNHGEIEKVEEWGKRMLSYPIKKKVEGEYLWFALKGELGLVRDLEAYLKLNERVLRHLILTRIISKKPKIQKVKPRETEEVHVYDEGRQQEKPK